MKTDDVDNMTLTDLRAVETIECECASCRRACAHKPGWFAPGEAEVAAEFLGVTLKELFDTKLMADWLSYRGPDGSDVFVLSPALVSAEPGYEAPADPRGTCVFLQEGRCAIHAVKPLECRLYSCQIKAEGAKYHEPVGMTWNAPEHQQQIQDLLGREPVAKIWWGV